ncbi:MAG: hypothetical protein MI924_31945 [Chloroflexales bacterium]|nr:hypothetical protein [Chloroflexales bacterium]
MHLRQHPRLISVTVLAACMLLMFMLRLVAPPAHGQTNYSLRFYGNGNNDIDRVKIPLDNPHRFIDVGASDFTIEFWMKANSGVNNSGTCSTGNDAWKGSGPTGNVSYRDGRPTSYPNDPYLVIGAEKHDEDKKRFPSFNGWIDEVRISNVIRYSGDFKRPAQPLNMDSHTMALYHFDEGRGATLRDISGQNDGTIKVGGNPQGPQWSTDNPFTGGGTAPSPTSSPPPPPDVDEFIYVPMVAR